MPDSIGMILFSVLKLALQAVVRMFQGKPVPKD
jgi:hypothetical protein